MKRFGKPLLLGALPLLAMTAAGPSRCLPGDKEEKKVEAKAVPLGSIYSTSRQERLKLIKRGEDDEAFPNELRELYEKSIAG